MKISYISLGCPKNEVDLETILGGLQSGAEIIHEPENADVVIINTCAFINDARQESVDHILAALEKRRHDPQFSVLVTGCLAQRYREELQREIPEISGYYDTTDPVRTLRQIQQHLHLPETSGRRMQVTPLHYAYLKIAEGCNNRCSYCAIPLIKGDYVSRPLDEIVTEAEQLAKAGVKELMVVAQDTTQYGHDLGAGHTLTDVLKSLARIDDLHWIRLLYTHPAHWRDEFIDTIASLDKVVNYIDLPIQHISDPILKSMGRHTTRREIETLIHKLRERIPGLTLRTSVITGYPGESKAHFRELLDFIEGIGFDRLGVFTYSQEQDTRAARLPDDVPDKVKQARKQEIMELQADIALFKNKELVGLEEKVIIDQTDHELNMAIGRTYRDSPDIDNTVILPLPAESGKIYRVRFTGADIYDLHGVIL